MTLELDIDTCCCALRNCRWIISYLLLDAVGENGAIEIRCRFATIV